MARLIESYGNVKIMEVDKGSLPLYIVIYPDFSDDEVSIIHNSRELMGDYRTVLKRVELFETSAEKEDFLIGHIKTQLKNKNISPENLDRIVSIIMDEIFMGCGRIGILLRDADIEEIMINSISSPIFIVHKKYGMCMTNIEYEDYESLDELISWISKYSGRAISEQVPLLDAHMPDGSRANVAVPPASPNGPAITIRKFKKTPYNIIDLISIGTITPNLAAFLWVCVEGFSIHPCNILIAGGSGSGKTTLLNALSMFIPCRERIVTVEDTLELNLGFLDNWVALEATPSVVNKENTKLDMHSLLENTLRMRPDRVFVGEVRGNEAVTLFIAMDIGLNGSMCTLHANNARETTIRVVDAPMNVPLRMFPLLDLIVVANRYCDRKRGMLRRVTEVSEVAGIEKDMIQLGQIYVWDSKTDKMSRTQYPIMLKEQIATRCGITKKELETELFVREKILEYMLRQDIRNNNDVINIFKKYYSDPKSIISMVGLRPKGR